jgi:CHASE3 domain sensor protein
MTITKKISLGFAIPIVLIIVVGVLARQVSTRLATTTEWVEHSMEVEVTMQKALTRMVDAETGARGFFITGVEVFLQPYVGAAADVMKLFDRASELTTDNSLQHARVEAARTTATTRLTALATGIEQRRRAPFDEATANSVLSTGKTAMDQLRQEFAAISDSETTLLASRRAEATAAVNRGEMLLLIAVVGGVLSALLASADPSPSRGCRPRDEWRPHASYRHALEGRDRSSRDRLQRDGRAPQGGRSRGPQALGPERKDAGAGWRDRVAARDGRRRAPRHHE